METQMIEEFGLVEFLLFLVLVAVALVIAGQLTKVLKSFGIGGEDPGFITGPIGGVIIAIGLFVFIL